MAYLLVQRQPETVGLIVGRSSIPFSPLTSELVVQIIKIRPEVSAVPNCTDKIFTLFVDYVSKERGENMTKSYNFVTGGSNAIKEPDEDKKITLMMWDDATKVYNLAHFEFHLEDDFKMVKSWIELARQHGDLDEQQIMNEKVEENRSVPPPPPPEPIIVRATTWNPPPPPPPADP